MSLITLFSAPKPFTNPHIATIQRNAIKSWTLLPNVEVILFGDEKGLVEAAHELDVKHIADVKCNKSGTPLISSMFQLVRENSTSELLCIINADMILLPGFVEAAEQAVKLKDKFVLLSSDFFLFPKFCYIDVPDFTIGRAGWDNWMIYKARKENWFVIDCTPSVRIVHQNHDYSHLPGGKPHYEHPDTNENIRLAGGQANIRYTILDATHQLVDGKLIRPKMTSLRFTRKLELFLRAIFFFLPEKTVENVARPKRWKKRIQKLFK